MHVGLVLEPNAERGKKIIGVAALSFRQIVGDVRLVRQLGWLAKLLVEKVAVLKKEYEQKVLEIGRNLPLDDLYTRAKPDLAGTGVRSVGEARK